MFVLMKTLQGVSCVVNTDLVSLVLPGAQGAIILAGSGFREEFLGTVDYFLELIRTLEEGEIFENEADNAL
jgi:hypothetical protein